MKNLQNQSSWRDLGKITRCARDRSTGCLITQQKEKHNKKKWIAALRESLFCLASIILCTTICNVDNAYSAAAPATPNTTTTAAAPQAPAAPNTAPPAAAPKAPAPGANQGNPFLDYYTRQGTVLFKENSSFFHKSGDKLTKKSMDIASVKKAVVIFFGDWCPHCEEFLTNFAKHIELIRLAGVNIIFVGVPSIERLKNWQDPTLKEFNDAEGKITVHNIKLTKNTFVTMIGSGSVLASCGVEGLPVIVAIKDGKEKFRAVGANAVQKMNFSNDAVLKQFLEIWDEDSATESSESDTSAVKVDNDKEQAGKDTGGKKKYSSKKKSGENLKKPHRHASGSSSSDGSGKKVNKSKANTITSELNRAKDSPAESETTSSSESDEAEDQEDSQTEQDEQKEQCKIKLKKKQCERKKKKCVNLCPPSPFLLDKVKESQQDCPKKPKKEKKCKVPPYLFARGQ